MSRTGRFAALLLAPVPAVCQPRAAAPPPDTEIALAPLTSSAGRGISVGRPTNITNSPGYDNQPSFTPDGRAI
jgi:hypothetical protein